MRQFAVIALLLAGCKEAAVPESEAVSEIKRALAERDKKLRSFHFTADSTQGEVKARHEFFHRAPNRMRGVLFTPKSATYSFDGTRLYRLDGEAKTFTQYEMKLPAQKAAFFLHSTFAPFVFEGFRAPLLPSSGVLAKTVDHPKGPKAIELTVASKGDGVEVSTTYVLRWPTADFLGKRQKSGADVTELKVEDEKCDEALALCVPVTFAETLNGQPVGSTRISHLELNPELTQDSFSLAAPEGWSSEKHDLVEAD